MIIKYLDSSTTGADINVDKFKSLGEVTFYEHLSQEEVPEAVKDADVIIVNKLKINEQSVGGCKNLKLVCEAATGTDNIDKAYLESRGIKWCNVAGYSTETVAQHTLAVVLYLEEALPFYDHYVKSGEYCNSPIFTNFSVPFHDIAGKTWGIIGLGAIGRRVAEIAKFFGCRVIYYSTSGKNHQSDYEEVDFDTLLKESDYVTVHAPLTEQTKYLMNKDAFAKMKKSAIFVNVGRGPIVKEDDLVEALNNNVIRAASLDVLECEPMRRDNPLLSIQDSKKLLITPHIAWASVEARERLLDKVYQNIQQFFG